MVCLELGLIDLEEYVRVLNLVPETRQQNDVDYRALQDNLSCQLLKIHGVLHRDAFELALELVDRLFARIVMPEFLELLALQLAFLLLLQRIFLVILNLIKCARPRSERPPLSVVN